MNPRVVQEPSNEEIIGEWKAALDKLWNQIEAWSGPRGFTINRTSKVVAEEQLPPYPVDVLTISSPKGRFHFEPIARLIIGGTGRVDVYSTHYDLMMLRVAEGDTWPPISQRWVVYAPGLVPLYPDWSESSFAELAELLLAD